MTRALTQPRKMSLTDPRHLMRFMKFQAMSGTDAEKYAAISRSEHVSAATVKDSVQMVEQYRAQNSTAEMDFAIRSLVVGAIPKAKQTLEGLLDATEMVEVTDLTTGKKRHIMRPDKTTRIEGMKLVSDLVGKMQPKAAATEVNVHQTTQVQTNLSKAETMEERLRRLRKKAQEFNQLPPEVAGVPESIDRGDESDDDSGEEEDEGDNE